MEADLPRGFPTDWRALRSKIHEIFNLSRVFREVRITGPEADRQGRVAAEVGFGREPAFIRIVAPSAETVWAILFEVAWGIVKADGRVPLLASGAKEESERECPPSRGRKQGDELLFLGRENMPTIVEYTDKKPPENMYPWLIVSPPRSGPCCFSEMEEIGTAQRKGRWESVYKRCRTCGFAVQVILRECPDPVLVTGLRALLDRSFRRNPPG